MEEEALLPLRALRPRDLLLLFLVMRSIVVWFYWLPHDWQDHPATRVSGSGLSSLFALLCTRPPKNWRDRG
ncbi:Uncharacterised protein [Vibrio cholerae]|nr:Uncharacterised protein [Vibrio cholerae]